MREPSFVYELPFAPGARFRVSQGYGGTYSHTGKSYYSLDFTMPENTLICAARSGVVYRVTSHFAAGGTHPSFKPRANAIHVLHPDDTVASYLHLMQWGALVHAGQSVRTGQPIGFSGNTGWSDHPHLHFHVADAAYHERIPVEFNLGKHGTTELTTWRSYRRPVSHEPQSTAITSTAAPPEESRGRDPFAFSPELLSCKTELAGHLSEAGYDSGADYSSIDVLHDVHGLEVCGIHNPELALEITRLLLRLFPGWNAGWLHPPGSSSNQAWVATVQRDHDSVVEYWEGD